VNKNFWIFFILVFLIRIFLFNFPSFHIDMNTWEAWAYRLVNGGFPNFYSKEFYSEYFPGYLYFLWVLGNIYHIIFSKLSFSSFQFEVLIKSVTTVFDLGTSYLIYKIVLSIKPKFAPIAALIYFVNPAVIFNSSVWGQIDGIYTFFIVLSSYFLIGKNKIFTSTLLSSIAFLIKPQAIFLLPISFFTTLKNQRLISTFSSVIIFTFLTFILSFPFFPSNPVTGFIGMAQRSADLYPYTSLFAFNFWSIFGWWRLDSQSFIFSFKTWGIIFYSLSLIAIIIPNLLKKVKRIKLATFYSMLLLSFFSSFLFLTRMHERYLFPVLAVFLIYAISNKRALILYYLISVVHLLNLWYVYYYYDFIYNNPSIAPNALYNFIDSYHSLFSVFLIVSFFVILVHYYSPYVKKTA